MPVKELKHTNKQEASRLQHCKATSTLGIHKAVSSLYWAATNNGRYGAASSLLLFSLSLRGSSHVKASGHQFVHTTQTTKYKKWEVCIWTMVCGSCWYFSSFRRLLPGCNQMHIQPTELTTTTSGVLAKMLWIHPHQRHYCTAKKCLYWNAEEPRIELTFFLISSL